MAVSALSMILGRVFNELLKPLKDSWRISYDIPKYYINL